MKKIILTISVIAIIALLSLTFVACNNATTQGQLANLLNDHNHEAFEYKVYAIDSNGVQINPPGFEIISALVQGTYTVTLDAYDEGATIENFGKGTLTNVKRGVLVRSVLTMAGITYDSGCYYTLINASSYMVPANTYRIITVGGVEQFSMSGEYSGATLNYEMFDGENTTTGKVSASGTYFDNNQFQQSLRTITTFSSNFNFSFATPIVSKSEVACATLTASISSTSYVKTPFTEQNSEYQERGITCYKMHLSRSTEVSGLSQTLYYATQDITDNGWSLKNVLVMIEEPFKTDNGICTMVYELVSASLS